jgi:Ca2+-binding RTX toxin-like protein
MDMLSFEFMTGGMTLTLGPGGDGTFMIETSTQTYSGFEGLVGSGYADDLTGNSEDNLLFGSGGNDTISGVAGNDTIHGGAGADRYNYENTSEITGCVDTYHDFNHTDDTFQFDGNTFDTSAGFVNMSGYDGSNSGYGDAVFVYDADTDELYYDHDGDGGDTAELIAEFTNNPDDFDATDIDVL